MRQLLISLIDLAAAAFGVVTSPILRLIGRSRESLPRFQKVADRFGFQLRSDHYYEPTYRDADLPADVRQERDLPGLDLNEAFQLDLLSRFRWAEELSAIPLAKPSEAEFGYDNVFYTHGDAETLYNMIRAFRPARIFEIGSGQSTLMARLAIRANEREDVAYACRHLCVEPYEAKWLESVGVEVLRQRVEHLDPGMFEDLQAGDILFIDSSHVIRPYGDVLIEFQRIVPRLAPGVLVHVHDIFTPRDYLESWLRERRRLWNEQYLLESFLTFNGEFEVVMANNWLKHNHFDAFAAACPMVARFPDCEPGSFWFRRKPDD